MNVSRSGYYNCWFDCHSQHNGILVYPAVCRIGPCGMPDRLLRGGFGAEKAMKKAMSLSMEVVKHSRRWTYYAELFEQAQYGKEIRMNGMTQWLLSREKQVVAKANANIAQQNNCYIASGVKRAGLTFLQQSASYGVLIWKVLSGSLGIGSFTMCISAVTSFSVLGEVYSEGVQFQTSNSGYGDQPLPLTILMKAKMTFK